MIQYFIGLHAALGEIASFAFLWIFVELLNPTAARIYRAQLAAASGLVLFLASWLSGGYYYLIQYGPQVKPLIKSGPSPWAHNLIMELKEHIFLFLPLLALVNFYSLCQSEAKILSDDKYRNGLLVLSACIFLIGMSMAGMGYLISLGYRVALEGGGPR